MGLALESDGVRDGVYEGFYGTLRWSREHG